jgi:hypothetical protein
VGAEVMALFTPANMPARYTDRFRTWQADQSRFVLTASFTAELMERMCTSTSSGDRIPRSLPYTGKRLVSSGRMGKDTDTSVQQSYACTCVQQLAHSPHTRP